MEFAVVTSLDGYDEISLTNEFKVIMKHYERIYRPEEMGIPSLQPQELFGGNTPQEAARIFDDILYNRATGSQKTASYTMPHLPYKFWNRPNSSTNAPP